MYYDDDQMLMLSGIQHYMFCPRQWALIHIVPYMGTWIETYRNRPPVTTDPVVPYMGTWIETHIAASAGCSYDVVPYMGTWIETLTPVPTACTSGCRPLHGDVD